MTAAITLRNLPRLPDIRPLRTFVAVVQCGNFSLAGRQLHMTQPGVTTHIRKLEQQVGQRLIERRARSLLLTEAGKTVYTFALDFLDQYQEMLERVAPPGSSVPRWLRTAAPGSFAGFLVHHFSALQKEHPSLRFGISFQSNEAIVRDLGLGLLEVGFLTERPNTSGFVTEQILSEDIVVVGHKPHALTILPTADSVREQVWIDYPDRPLLLGAWTAHHYGEEFGQADALQLGCFVNNLDAVFQLVVKGHGYAIVPLRAARTHPFQGQLQIVQGARPAPLRQPLYWTTRSTAPELDQVRLLRDSLKQVDDQTYDPGSS